MQKFVPTLQTLRIMAGEGDFNIYRQLAAGKKLFLFVKCLLITWSYAHGRGELATKKTVALVKGPNQKRYQKKVAEQLSDEFESVELFMTSLARNSELYKLLPRINFWLAVQQVIYLLCMLFTGRKRYLNLYLLSFYSSIFKSVQIGFSNVENFICFNDQPFDVAAIVHALNRSSRTRTIVIQHGLILSEKFYFPSVANEFWAWGELSKAHYRSWNKNGKILIRGRYKNDISFKKNNYLWPDSDQKKSFLIAPSHIHSEVKEIIKVVRSLEVFSLVGNSKLGIKFHPSTKFTWILKFWCRFILKEIIFEVDEMEGLSDSYDFLITKSSTSSVDFILKGKPVFFLDNIGVKNLTLVECGFNVSDLNFVINNKNIDDSSKNLRNKLLIDAINV